MAKYLYSLIVIPTLLLLVLESKGQSIDKRLKYNEENVVTNNFAGNNKYTFIGIGAGFTTGYLYMYLRNRDREKEPFFDARYYDRLITGTLGALILGTAGAFIDEQRYYNRSIKFGSKGNHVFVVLVLGK